MARNSKHHHDTGIRIGSPSEAYRLRLCPGSWKIQPREQLITEFSEAGTLAHESAAVAIQAHRPEFVADAIKEAPRNLRGAVTDYVSWVESLKAYHPNGSVWVEVSASTYPILPRSQARIDFVLHCPDTKRLYVVDFKSGSGHEVMATENEQLIIYADAFIRQFAPLIDGSIDDVHLVIIQPRMKPEPDVWALPIDEFRKAFQRLYSDLQRCYRDDPELISGTEQCQFCRAKARCPQIAKDALEGIKDRLEWDKVYTLDDFRRQLENTEQLKPEDMALIVKIAPLLRTWLKGIEDHALSDLRQGKSIPGMALGKGRAHRKWVNPDEAKQYLFTKGLDTSEVVEEKLISPSKAEELLGRSNVPVDLWEAPIGKDVIVSEDEKLANLIASGVFND